jgi:hypothetical protein
VAATRCNTKDFLLVIAVKAHFSADPVAFFDHRENISGVLPEHISYPVHIPRELLMVPSAEAAAKAIVSRRNVTISKMAHNCVELPYAFNGLPRVPRDTIVPI